MNYADVIIVGGGIVGLATAYQMGAVAPRTTVLLLEKESRLGQHQTGHNSGVLHSGIYYRPGSLKAVNCRQGNLSLQQFCQQHQVPYEMCGKVIVAVESSELPALQRIFERGQANGVRCQMVNQHGLRELEPHAAGVGAIHVLDAGIIDFGTVCSKLAMLITQAGQRIETGAKVFGVQRSGAQSLVKTTRGDFACRLIINCAGLYCDRVSRLGQLEPPARILPFRGEYYELRPARQHLCRNLIYPVPDPKFPFLGVHFTRMIGGGVECGPNAVLALAREGYKKTSINLGELAESLTYSGFLRLAARHWQMGLAEMWRSCSKSAFVRALKKLLPEIEAEDLTAAPAGVRAQAVLPDGQLVDDFLIVENQQMITVNNAPSPAATASLNIGRLVVQKALERLQQAG